MAVKNYLINDKWLDIDKQNIVEVKSTDGVIGSVKVNGEEYGGGGESDFSTAHVTVITRGDSTATALAMPAIRDSSRGSSIFIVTAIPADSEYDVPLYKGECNVRITSGQITNVTGNAELAGSILTITGDCSFISYYRQQ